MNRSNVRTAPLSCNPASKQADRSLRILCYIFARHYIPNFLNCSRPVFPGNSNISANFYRAPRPIFPTFFLFLSYISLTFLLRLCYIFIIRNESSRGDRLRVIKGGTVGRSKQISALRSEYYASIGISARKGPSPS